MTTNDLLCALGSLRLDMCAIYIIIILLLLLFFKVYIFHKFDASKSWKTIQQGVYLAQMKLFFRHVVLHRNKN